MVAADGASRAAAPAAPLAGLTFLNTREASVAGRLTQLLQMQGAAVVEQPTLAYAPPTDWAPFDTALDALRSGQWIVFSSPTAVRFTIRRLAERGVPLERLARGRIAVVGPGTQQAVESAGLTVSLVPDRYQAEGLLEALLPRLSLGERIWQPRAAEARPVLEKGLAAAGISLTISPAYCTVMPEGGLDAARRALIRGELDWLVFTSGSAARHFRQMATAELDAPLFRLPVACLGSIAAAVAHELGFTVRVVPEVQALPSLVAAIVDNVTPGARLVSPRQRCCDRL